jgi:hypothetical protein
MRFLRKEVEGQEQEVFSAERPFPFAMEHWCGLALNR